MPQGLQLLPKLRHGLQLHHLSCAITPQPHLGLQHLQSAFKINIDNISKKWLLAVMSVSTVLVVDGQAARSHSVAFQSFSPNGGAVLDMAVAA